jgi:hypothetical protein
MGLIASLLIEAIISEESCGVLNENPESLRFRESSVMLGNSIVSFGGPLNSCERYRGGCQLNGQVTSI